MSNTATDKPRLRHPEKAHKPDNPSPRKPDWIRVKAPTSPEYVKTRNLIREHNLHTVCEEASCPNIGECWAQRHATVMILGEVCTRACAFCNVTTGKPGGVTDPMEPVNTALATAKLGLRHMVITSVDRDDLADGGADQFARCIEELRKTTPDTTVEVLTPGGGWSSYPPHKHDEFTDDEVALEEIYYFRIDGDDGFGFFSCYTLDGEVDDSLRVRDGDAYLVPFGYHGPAAATPGHDMYYLNVMAGPATERIWRFCDDPVHAWAREAFEQLPPDPRMPLATVKG